MKKILISAFSLFFIASVYADSSIQAPKEFGHNETPKECLKALPIEPGNKDGKPEKEEEPTWFEKIVKHHKLGSLHFQDIIELFH